MRPTTPDLLSRLGQNIQTQANNANPSMRVSVSRAKNAVVDSNYWTVETIREGVGLGEVSVSPRRFTPKGKPNRLYGAYIQNGILKTIIREYPDKLKVGFVDQFTLGPAKSVSVSFDGGWRKAGKFWRLITEEKPWVFWVDDTNKLWAQVWDDESTKISLMDDVLVVKSIRAWKNVSVTNVDQGLIVSCIKTDGTVWYISRAHQHTGELIWEVPRQLTGFIGTATHINLFLTNDYRVGFLIRQSSGDVYWFISSRSWSGMAIPNESIEVKVIGFTFETTPIQYFESAESDNIRASVEYFSFDVYPHDFNFNTLNVVSAIKLDNYRVELTFNYEVVNISPIGFTLNGVNASSASVGSTSKKIILTSPNPLPIFDNTPVVLSGGVSKLVVGVNTSPRIPDFTQTAPGSPVAVSENIQAAVINFSFNSSSVIYSNYYSDYDNINCRVIGFTFTSTKVGSNPL